MSDEPQSEFDKALTALIDAKTFSPEHLEKLASLRKTAAATENRNKQLIYDNECLRRDRDDTRRKYDELVAQVGGLKARAEAAETKAHAYEIRQQVAEGKSETYKECFGLVFRNIETRRMILKTTPVVARNPDYSNSGFGQPPSVNGGGERIEDRKSSRDDTHSNE